MKHTSSNRQARGKAVRRRRCRPPCLEPLEERCQPSVTGFRPIDEIGNNVANPTWGTVNTDLLRLSPAAYADGISSPSLPNDPSARVISDMVNNQNDPNNPGQDLNTIDQNSLSDFGYAWGQFIDHDMDLTPGNPNEALQILADPNDPSHMGNQTFDRSVFDPTTGNSTGNPRQQINAITAYLDLSNVYGSTQAVANALRTFTGGLLKTSPGNMLPYNNATYFSPTPADPDPNQLAELNMANDAQAVPSNSLFAAGDVRANENVELTALQTLFVRNHNAIATELATMNPADFGFTSWTDEELYQEARKLNIAEEQIITYTEYLPDVLGPNALPAYAGYNPHVNAGIATEFSTVAFRFGHSLLSGGIERADNNGADAVPNDPAGPGISLATDFFDPNVLNPAGVTDPLTGHISTDIDPILKGDADGNSQAMDVLAINDVRNLLFANGGLQDNGQDLIARDVERARDDGIGTYNQVRVALGLPAVTRFSQITSNVTVQNELRRAYGSVNNIDPFEGGLAEDHFPGSDMGPLFTAVLAKQFQALRDGDRFFYLNETFNSNELTLLRQGNTLTKVIEANTSLTNLQSDAIRFRALIRGTVFNDLNGNAVQDRGEGALSGRVVELEDDAGNVLAKTLTDANGHYAFSNLNGITTGHFQVLALPPNNVTVTTPNPVAITFTRGDQSITVNIGEKRIWSGSTTDVGSSGATTSLARVAQVDVMPPAPSPATSGTMTVVAAPPPGVAALAATFMGAPTSASATPAGPSGGGTTAPTDGGSGAVAGAATPPASGSVAPAPGATSLMLGGGADDGGTATDGLDPTAVDALIQTLAPLA
jgi:hypothetical protein